MPGSNLPLVLAATALLLACDGFTSVQVKVVRCGDEAPIVGARVEAFKNRADKLAGYTDTQGVFEDGWVSGSSGPPEGGVDVRIEKPGYRVEEQHVSGALSNRPDVCLTPMP